MISLISHETEPVHWDISGNFLQNSGHHENFDLLSARQKPDLIIFDPPYFDKKAKDYDKKSIANLSKIEYLHFLESFFAFLKEYTKKTTRLAFINADWRDFQHRPATEEPPEEAVMIDDYLNLLAKTGWQRTHHIQAPLSSERFEAGVVSAMQKKRILGVTSRYIIIAKQQ